MMLSFARKDNDFLKSFYFIAFDLMSLCPSSTPPAQYNDMWRKPNDCKSVSLTFRYVSASVRTRRMVFNIRGQKPKCVGRIKKVSLM